MFHAGVLDDLRHFHLDWGLQVNIFLVLKVKIKKIFLNTEEIWHVHCMTIFQHGHVHFFSQHGHAHCFSKLTELWHTKKRLVCQSSVNCWKKLWLGGLKKTWLVITLLDSKMQNVYFSFISQRCCACVYVNTLQIIFGLVWFHVQTQPNCAFKVIW